MVKKSFCGQWPDETLPGRQNWRHQSYLVAKEHKRRKIMSGPLFCSKHQNTKELNWTDIWPAWQNWRHQSNLVAKEISTQKKEEILSGHYILFKTPKYKIEYEWYRSKNCSCKFPRKRTAFGYAFSLRIFQWDTTAFSRIDPRHWLGGPLRNVFRFPLVFLHSWSLQASSKYPKRQADNDYLHLLPVTSRLTYSIALYYFFLLSGIWNIA